LSRATAYYLLRPFFSPKIAARDPTAETYDEAFLADENWQLEPEPTSWLQGASPGHCQELRAALHPHLNLPSSMVHVPKVQPGDYVSWHCDTIHGVDSVHAGSMDSSVLYIPSCPLTVANAEFVAQQREAVRIPSRSSPSELMLIQSDIFSSSTAGHAPTSAEALARAST